MTTLTMRYMRGHFIVTGPDIEPVMFKSRREAREWCTEHHAGSPIREVGANSSKQRPSPSHRNWSDPLRWRSSASQSPARLLTYRC